jgi:glycosyltransferase involved in cell wall biosynthesis
MSHVSVVIPTCDRPSRLQRALDSVLAQERPADEILVVDDGTEPLSPHQFPGEVTLVPGGGRRGACWARNRGAALARSPWLAFLDDDDHWHPAYLAEAMEAATRHDARLVLTAFTKVRELDGAWELNPEKVPPTHLASEDFYVRNPGLRGSNLFIRRDLYQAIGGFDESLPSHNDLDLGIRLFAQPGLRYCRNALPRVLFHVHSDPRLSTPGSTANVAGMRSHFERYADTMGPARAAAFRNRCLDLFGVDPAPGVI